MKNGLAVGSQKFLSEALVEMLSMYWNQNSIWITGFNISYCLMRPGKKSLKDKNQRSGINLSKDWVFRNFVYFPNRLIFQLCKTTGL